MTRLKKIYKQSIVKILRETRNKKEIWETLYSEFYLIYSRRSDRSRYLVLDKVLNGAITNEKNGLSFIGYLNDKNLLSNALR